MSNTQHSFALHMISTLASIMPFTDSSVQELIHKEGLTPDEALIILMWDQHIRPKAIPEELGLRELVASDPFTFVTYLMFVEREPDEIYVDMLQQPALKALYTQYMKAVSPEGDFVAYQSHLTPEVIWIHQNTDKVTSIYIMETMIRMFIKAANAEDHEEIISAYVEIQYLFIAYYKARQYELEYHGGGTRH